MIVLTPEQMISLDQEVIKEGFPSILLMETAGRKVFDIIKERFFKKNILIFVGTGNNGGDGLVLARLLDIYDLDVKIIVVGSKDKFSDDFNTNFKICKLRDLNIEFASQSVNYDNIKKQIKTNQLIVDAMLGTGLTNKLRSPFLEIVKLINQDDTPVISVDIPTGLNGKTGKVMGDAVKADLTASMAFCKTGHFLYPGREYTNQLEVVDLGFPLSIVNKNKYNHFTLNKREAFQLLPKRSKTGHKGNFGKVLVVGGNIGYEGAPVLTAKSALKTGSGLVKIVTDQETRKIISNSSLEIITEVLKTDLITDNVNKYNVVALGVGLGVSEEKKKMISQLIKKCQVPLIIDADGINNLKLSLLKDNDNSNLILTPHPGEFSNLIGKSITEIEKNRVTYARQFALKYKITLVLKGATSIVALSNGELFLNRTGNDGMATAGSGDVLTGIISSLCGQNISVKNSAVLGTYLHGLAGDIAKEKFGNYSLTAQDILDNISSAILKISGGV
ncbi:MAG: NAD(P)H-hydrate dehydratase [Halanaerobiales bacterium]|nr:NAD(P)H-hydrate dehydratase [Halanaerobiales bacterium]